MDNLTLTYIHNKDMYYFPNREIYVSRWMFLYADAGYLAHMLGLEFLNDKSRDSLFSHLAQENQKATYIELNFHE